MRDDELQARLLAYIDEGGQPRRVAPSPAELRRRGYRTLLGAAVTTLLVIALAAGGTVVWASRAGGHRDVGVVNQPGPVPSTSRPSPSAASTPRATASTSPPPPDTPGRLSAGSMVTTTGIGPVKVGMTVSQAERAGGVALARTMDEYYPRCWYVVPKGWPKVRDLDLDRDPLGFLVADGRIARIDVWAGSTSTRAGIRIGSTAQQVEQAYPGDITVSRNRFGSRLLTFTSSEVSDARHRIVFETGGDRVTGIRAGRLPEVNYDEGCA